MNLNLAVIAMQNMSQFNFTDTEQSTLYASYFYGYAPVMVLSHGSLESLFKVKYLLSACYLV